MPGPERIHVYRDKVNGIELDAFTYPYGQNQPGHGLQITLIKDVMAVLSVRLPAPDAAALIRALLVAFPDSLGDAVLTPSEVAKLFRVDPKTVTRWVHAGRIPSTRTPGGHHRYRMADVMPLLEQRSDPDADAD